MQISFIPRTVALAAVTAMSAPSAFAQTATLVPTSASSNALFGIAVDLQGSWCIGGARQHTAGALNQCGAAFLFERVGTSWIEHAQLTASDAEALDFFGSGVAIDCDTALVGADWEGANGSHFGAVYVYVRNGLQWSEQAKLVAPQRVHNSLFGRSVALSGDTAVIGAVQDCYQSLFVGSVHVFVRSGTSWTHQAMLTVNDVGNDAAFGYDVAVEGDRLIASSPYDNDYSTSDVGSAHVFERTGSLWIKQAKLAANVQVNHSRFGASVALEGQRAVFGTYALPGTAYVFEQLGGVWTQSAILDPIDTASTACFGFFLDLSGDRVAVGAVFEASNQIPQAGAAYLFDFDGASWSQTQRLISPSPAYDDSFCVVALDGTTLAVGELRDGASDVGSIQLYELGGLASYCTAGTTTSGCTPHLSLDGTPRVGGLAPALLTASGIDGHTAGYIFVGANTTATPWSQASTSTLCVRSPLVRFPPELDSGGTANSCDGLIRADIHGYVQAHGGTLIGQAVVAGLTVHAQTWFRDPPAPHTSNLSDALTFTFYP